MGSGVSPCSRGRETHLSWHSALSCRVWVESWCMEPPWGWTLILVGPFQLGASYELFQRDGNRDNEVPNHDWLCDGALLLSPFCSPHLHPQLPARGSNQREAECLQPLLRLIPPGLWHCIPPWSREGNKQLLHSCTDEALIISVRTNLGTSSCMSVFYSSHVTDIIFALFTSDVNFHRLKTILFLPHFPPYTNHESNALWCDTLSFHCTRAVRTLLQPVSEHDCSCLHLSPGENPSFELSLELLGDFSPK